MNKDKEIMDIIADVLEISPLEVHKDDTVGNIDGWDSIHQLMIISTLEEHYNIHFPDDALFEMNSVESIVKTTESLL